MGFTAKAKGSNEGWGMGFLLVFFPEDEAVINKKKTTTNTTINTLLRRSNSNHLLSRAQSTISICALLIFITLLLFTLSTFEPTTTNHIASRKQLSLSSPSKLYKTSRKFPHSPPPWPISLITNQNSRYRPKITSLPSPTSHALQGMGTLYRRGTRSMNDLIVAHVLDSLTAHELRLFVRLLHRSGLTSRSDIAFIFPSTSHSSEFDDVIREENESFLKLVRQYEQMNGTDLNSKASFDVTQFVKLAKNENQRGEPLWGRRIRSNYSGEGEGELTRLSYGSVVGFEVDELDPENSLAGLLDHVPMSLRRWACYPMLLGRVRRNFKHTMLVDVKEILLLGDPFGRVRNRSPESVYLSTVSESTTSNNKHGRKKSVKTQSHDKKLVNPVIIVGGGRGVRRLSSAMLTEIARAAMQQKRKNSVSESGLFQQLVGNGFMLKSVNLISSTESIPDASSLTGFPGSLLSLSNHTVVKRGNSNVDLTSVVMKQLCSLEPNSSVYCDC